MNPAALACLHVGEAATAVACYNEGVTRSIDIYGGRLPEELPAYDVARAAQIVRLSPSTLRLWAAGDGQHEALFKPAERSPVRLSFQNLIESFVLASMRRVHGVSMQKVRKALRYVGNQLGYARPLIHTSFRTDGVTLFIEQADRLLDVGREGQVALRNVLDASLRRIDWEEDVAVRLYPWVRSTEPELQPKTIVIDPRRGFGKPVIVGTGIEARIVAERYRAGDSITKLAKEYGVTLEKIEDAIRCETREAA
jgi:uncharacterized protein (DUF433 family)